jgi:PKD repeat protein
MRKICYSLLLIAAMIPFSCKKKEETKPVPTVDFAYNPANPIAPALVNFTNLSTNATSYSWDFGNGVKSELPNPSVNYTTSGSFTVILTAKGDGGTNGATKTITILSGAPQANFTSNAAGMRAPALVTFTNTSINGASYLWDFGNGQTSTLQNPTANYTSLGTYNVSLTVTSASGQTNKITKSVTILSPATQAGISSVTIVNFPEKRPNGSNWDTAAEGTYPDVYFGLNYVGTTIPITGSVSSLGLKIEDLTLSRLPISFVPTGGGVFLNVTALYTPFDVNLFDAEPSYPHEFMGTTTFTLGNFKTASNPYPTNVEITNGAYTIRLGLIWQ